MNNDHKGATPEILSATGESGEEIRLDPESVFSAGALFGHAVEVAFKSGPTDRAELLGTIARAMASSLFAAVEVHVDKDLAIKGHRMILAEFIDAYDVSMVAKGRDLRMSKTIARLRDGAAKGAGGGA